MYNRYIPRPDGSYQRSRIPDPPPPPESSPGPAPQQPVPLPPPQPRPLPPPKPRPQRQPRRESPLDSSISSFLRQLLPKNFDSSDLLVVLLLLLMSGDCSEDQNTALLTLALYLFL